MFRSGRRAARALHTCVSLGPKFIAALLTALALWAGAPTRAAAQDAFFKFLNGTQEEAYAELKKRHDKAAEAKANLEILKATGGKAAEIKEAQEASDSAASTYAGSVHWYLRTFDRAYRSRHFAIDRVETNNMSAADAERVKNWKEAQQKAKQQVTDDLDAGRGPRDYAPTNVEMPKLPPNEVFTPAPTNTERKPDGEGRWKPKLYREISWEGYLGGDVSYQTLNATVGTPFSTLNIHASGPAVTLRGEVVSPSNLFIAGDLTAFGLRSGDFTQSSVFGSAFTGSAKASVVTLRGDAGIYFYDTPTSRLGAFVGFYGAEMNFTAHEDGSTSAESPLLHVTGQALRVGISGQTRIAPNLIVTGNVAFLPIYHAQWGDFDGRGTGFQAYGGVKYLVTPTTSVDVGANYKTVRASDTISGIPIDYKAEGWGVRLGTTFTLPVH